MTAPARSYAHAVAHFDDLVAAARTTLTGFSACVDVVSPLDDRLLARIREADPGPEARAFAELLLDHAHRGRGGERCADWSRGPAVLREVVHGRRAIGGTGAQAAQTLAALGAPASTPRSGTAPGSRRRCRCTSDRGFDARPPRA